MLHIGICDDEREQIIYLTALVRKWAEEREILLKISDFDSAENFLFRYEEEKSISILLLDIQMKALDGIELAKKIRGDNDPLQIIFVTGFADFMAEGYDVSALHYLMKPAKEDKLFAVLDKAYKNSKQAEKSLFVTIDGETHRILLGDILYLEAQGHYVHIKTLSQTFKIKANLYQMETSLGNGFFRCQRSFIVHLKYVRKITRNFIAVEDGTEIPLSRDLYEAANQAVIEFFP